MDVDKAMQAINKAGYNLEERTRADYATYSIVSNHNKIPLKDSLKNFTTISKEETEKIISKHWKDSLGKDYASVEKAMKFLSSWAQKIYYYGVPSTFCFYNSSAENIWVWWNVEVHLDP